MLLFKSFINKELNLIQFVCIAVNFLVMVSVYVISLVMHIYSNVKIYCTG